MMSGTKCSIDPLTQFERERSAAMRLRFDYIAYSDISNIVLMAQKIRDDGENHSPRAFIEMLESAGRAVSRANYKAMVAARVAARITKPKKRQEAK